VAIKRPEMGFAEVGCVEHEDESSADRERW
jgi:hypothetical protein